MDYVLLGTAGDRNDASLALVEDAPEGMGLHDYCLTRGDRATPHFPEDAKVFLHPERDGIKLSGILGNLNGFFIGSSKVKEVIEAHCKGCDIEFLPFTLYNQKKRVHSRDYWFINPIGGFECLNEPACGITFGDDGEVVLMDQIVLDSKKIANAPDLFRILKAPTNYVITMRLIQTLKANGVTNIAGRKLQAQ